MATALEFTTGRIGRQDGNGEGGSVVAGKQDFTLICRDWEIAKTRGVVREIISNKEASAKFMGVEVPIMPKMALVVSGAGAGTAINLGMGGVKELGVSSNSMNHVVATREVEMAGLRTREVEGCLMVLGDDGVLLSKRLKAIVVAGGAIKIIVKAVEVDGFQEVSIIVGSSAVIIIDGRGKMKIRRTSR